jgi:hypothetical protein
MITFFTLFASLLITISTHAFNQGWLSISTISNTLDKRDYYIVNDVFAYNNSRDELARYIRSY